MHKNDKKQKSANTKKPLKQYGKKKNTKQTIIRIKKTIV